MREPLHPGHSVQNRVGWEAKRGRRAENETEGRRSTSDAAARRPYLAGGPPQGGKVASGREVACKHWRK